MIAEKRHAETRLPIQEFDDPDYGTIFEGRLIAKLKEPTRAAGRLFMHSVGPEVWYGQVGGGVVGGADWDYFREQYRTRAQEDATLNNPYSYLEVDRSTGNWVARPITGIRRVRKELGALKDHLGSIADWIRSDRSDQMHILYLPFAEYIDKVSKHLPKGDVDSAMVAFLQVPPALRVRWLLSWVEYQDDPLGIRTSPEGLLAYAEKTATREANLRFEHYKKTARDIYGEEMLDAEVFNVNAIITSGFLGVGDRRISAFNIPNNPDVAKRAGRNVIYLFPRRIESKNEEDLSPLTQQWFGLSVSNEQAQSSVEAHEFVHQVRNPGEAERLSGWRSKIREHVASDGALALTSRGGFSSKLIESVASGNVDYAVGDVRDHMAQVFESHGRTTVTVSDLMNKHSYFAGAWCMLRRAVLEGYIGHSTGKFDVDGFTRLAEERTPILFGLLKSGSEEDVVHFYNDQLDHFQVVNNMPSSSTAA